MTKALWLDSVSQILLTIERGNLLEKVVRNWGKIHFDVSFLTHDNWDSYFRSWRLRSLFSGSALTCRDQSNVWSSQRLLHVIPKFETKIPRSVTFAQVNLMSVAPTLQNLRIVHKKRQSGKTKVPAKQRGSWPKVCSNERSMKEQHSSHWRKTGACVHQLWSLRNLLRTLVRQCTWYFDEVV